jgi:hypothetical protein
MMDTLIAALHSIEDLFVSMRRTDWVAESTNDGGLTRISMRA